MARYCTTIQSKMGADAAFSYMADFANAREWDPSVRSARRLDAGPVAAGSRFELVVSFARRTVQLEYSITTFDAPNVVVLSAHNSLFRSIDTVTVTAGAGGSSVEYDATLVGKGWFRLFDPLLALTFRRVGGHARDGLQRVLNP